MCCCFRIYGLNKSFSAKAQRCEPRFFTRVFAPPLFHNVDKTYTTRVKKFIILCPEFGYNTRNHPTVGDG
jgi:hypothetical protein